MIGKAVMHVHRTLLSTSILHTKFAQKLFRYKTEVPVSNNLCLTYATASDLQLPPPRIDIHVTHTNYKERPTSNWISAATPSKS